MELQEVQHQLIEILHEISIRFQRLPGSAILLRYIKSSYQNDPIRSAVELFLFLFAVRYLLAPAYSTKNKRKSALTEDEIDELVEDWTPEPLVAAATPFEDTENERRPVIVGPTGPKSKLSNGRTVTNLASHNFYNLTTNPYLQERAVQVLRAYGVGPCSPPNFYGTQDVHMKTEADIASHLGVPACIVYAQAFSTISSVIPAFSKRGDIIVADKAVGFAIRKGIQISRSHVRWYEHNDLEDMERVLQRVKKEQGGRELTRRFIVTEAVFENVGDVLDLPKVIALKSRYRFRLILDESSSFGVLGRTARGLTELQNVDPHLIDMIVGSLAGPLCAGGGFCAGSAEIVEHQRISAAAYTFSAALPAMAATTASEVLAILASTPGVAPPPPATSAATAAAIANVTVNPSPTGLTSNAISSTSAGATASGTGSLTTGQDLLSVLHDNIRTLWSQLDPRSDWVRCTSCPENPSLILVLKDEVLRSKGWDGPASTSLAIQESIMQDIVEECLIQGVLVTRVKSMPNGAAGASYAAAAAGNSAFSTPGTAATGIKGAKGSKPKPTTPPSSAGWGSKQEIANGKFGGGSSGDGIFNVQPALKVCATVGLGRKETERAGTVIRHAITKVVKGRR